MLYETEVKFLQRHACCGYLQPMDQALIGLNADKQTNLRLFQDPCKTALFPM